MDSELSLINERLRNIDYWSHFSDIYEVIKTVNDKKLIILKDDLDIMLTFSVVIPHDNTKFREIMSWCTRKIFYPLLKSIIQDEDYYQIKTTCIVRLRIATNMILKLYDFSNEQKNDIIDKLTKRFWDHYIVLTKYYIEKNLPF